MTERKVLLFGDSHADAVKSAIVRRDANGKVTGLKAYRMRKQKRGKVLGDISFEEFLEEAGRLGPDDVVVSLIGGNQHAVLSTIQHPRPFDFIEPGSDQTEPVEDTELVPYRVLESYFEQGIQNGDGRSIEALRDGTCARIVHVISPPPKPDSDFIRKFHETTFAEGNIAGLGVSSAELRMKFWRLQTRILRKLCQSLEIDALLPPKKALDGNGFLTLEYSRQDATHANRDYGELILRQIESRYVRSAN